MIIKVMIIGFFIVQNLGLGLLKYYVDISISFINKSISNRNMGITRVVTDFDGTVTEEKGLEPFFAAYSPHFCDLLGVSEAQYKVAIATIRKDMEAEPLKYAWLSNGFVSAPVTGDPIGSNTVAHIELMHRVMRGDLPELQVGNIPADEAAVQALKEKCYLEAYPQRKTFFRDGAANYLNSLEKMFPGNAAIMSNSKASSIRKKLNGLEGLEADSYLIGLAQKMVVSSESGQIQPDGFPIPVNPDRPEYLKNLSLFIDPDANPSYPLEWGIDLSNLAVIGDNFFLDVAPVLLKGGYGILLETEATQGYEIPLLKAHPRGHFAKNYDDALEFIKQHKE
jgi:hypothetical protein